jgi:glutamate racemase
VSALPIGIFDSGMGGLTVMRALVERLPHERFLYLGDTARRPYGTKSADTVERYAVQAAGALMRRGVKLVVVACNTASAVALPALQAALAPVPVIGVIGPGAEAAIAAAPAGPIAVLATEGTVRGGAYERALRGLAGNVEIVQQACPLFVPLAEEGLVEGPIVDLVVDHYLTPVLARTTPRAMVLGCTHFPALAPAIAAGLARRAVDCRLVDSAVTTADAVARLLSERGLASRARNAQTHHFLSTDAPERFERVGRIFLGYNPDHVELVDLQAE